MKIRYLSEIKIVCLTVLVVFGLIIVDAVAEATYSVIHSRYTRTANDIKRFNKIKWDFERIERNTMYTKERLSED